MRVGFEGECGLVLPQAATVEASPAEGKVEDPGPLRRRIDLRPESRPLVRAGGDDDPRLDLERRVEMLECRDVVPLEVLARLRPHVERRGEDSPVLHAPLQVGDERRLQLEEELPDPESLRTGLKGDVEVGLSDPRPGDEPHGGVEAGADPRPVQRHVPAVVGIVQLEAVGVVDLGGSAVVGAQTVEVEAQVRPPLEVGRGEPGVGPDQAVVSRSGRVPAGGNRADP